MNYKKWYDSKTVLTGMIAIATAAITWLETGGTWETLAIGVLGALVVMLRTITDTPISK